MKPIQKIWQSLSLRTQLTVFFIVMTVILTATLTYNSIQRETNRLVEGLEEQALVLLDVFDDAIINDLENLNVIAIKNTLTQESSVWSQAQVYDATGRLIVDTAQDGVVFSLTVDQAGVDILSTRRSKLVWSEDGLMATKPIETGRRVIGAIALTFPTSTLDQAITDSLLSSSIISLIFAAVTALIVVWIAYTIASPIQSLTRSAKSIAEGDLDQLIYTTGSSEIDTLSVSLDEMRRQVKAVRNNLEELVNVRTLDLEKALKVSEEAQAEAERANTAKTTFLAKVSHELRTPLGAILGFAEMLQEGMVGSLNNNQKELTGEIIDSTNFLNELVSEILDHSRLASGRFNLRSKPFEFDILQDNIQSLGDAYARQKGNQLLIEVDDSMPPVIEGDQRRIEQIILNLVSNAAKFTDKGTVYVRFKTVHNNMVIEVEDTGIGIPTEMQNIIFDPFRQVDDTTTRNHQGSGLGLSIVKQLVELMNGDIAVKSELNIGSKFTVTFPHHVPEDSKEIVLS